jgi:hypothetical protein
MIPAVQRVTFDIFFEKLEIQGRKGLNISEAQTSNWHVRSNLCSAALVLTLLLPVFA